MLTHFQQELRAVDGQAAGEQKCARHEEPATGLKFLGQEQDGGADEAFENVHRSSAQA